MLYNIYILKRQGAFFTLHLTQNAFGYAKMSSAVQAPPIAGRQFQGKNMALKKKSHMSVRRLKAFYVGFRPLCSNFR